MRRDETLAILAAHREELRRRGVRSLALFGSVARDEARPDSDVDLLVELERPAGIFKLVAVQDYLQTILHCNVDLVTRGGLKRQLRERILAEAIDAA
jgi:predicted nucleotidyltransferase